MRIDNKTPLTPQPLVTQDVKKSIHLVDILDSSGSMGRDTSYMKMDNKYQNAISSIVDKVKEFSKETSINYTYSLVQFSSHNQIVDVFNNTPIQLVMPPLIANLRSLHGSTALNDAIAKTLNRLIAQHNPNEGVIVNIITDGGENSSVEYRNRFKDVAEIIRKAEELNILISFIGTEQDVQFAINRYGVDASNTLVYDGSAEGLRSASMDTFASTLSYSKSVSEGISFEELKSNFYTK